MCLVIGIDWSFRVSAYEYSTDIDVDVWDERNPLFTNVLCYKRFVDKLICLTVTRPDITTVVGLVS